MHVHYMYISYSHRMPQPQQRTSSNRLSVEADTYTGLSSGTEAIYSGAEEFTGAG